jgi:hypothetical protein
MQVAKNVKAIERLFILIDEAGKVFLDGVEIRCPIGCDKCCHGKNITASPLEYLPYSYHLFNEGILEEKFWEYKDAPKDTCFLLDKDTTTLKGRCGNYAFRGFECRLFGNAASVLKTGEKSFSGCRILKDQITNEGAFQSHLQKTAPVYAEFYMNLRAVDNNYGGLLYPINEAILKSMEIVYNNTRHKRPTKA